MMKVRRLDIRTPRYFHSDHSHGVTLRYSRDPQSNSFITFRADRDWAQSSMGLVRAVVYSPDMTLIATGGQDEHSTGKPIEFSVKIWDAKTGKLVATLKGHTEEVRCLAWTKDGKTLISASYNHSIRTWGYLRLRQPVTYQ
ncbi:WD40 repeat-like protein [Suillus weaverae]|nr:WD40 repeat-like protein [Suillus weaverae]